MKKTKTVNFLKSGILLFGIFLLLWSCEKEANSNNLLPDKKIETVNINEALDFLNINTDLVSKKSGFNRPYVVPDTKLISQENLVESDQLMTVIPATTVYKELYSRILLLKINDKIKSVVFSMYRNKDVKTENFSGEIIITDLKGGFLNGYRVDNGNIVTQFKRKEEKNKASLLFIGNSIAALFQDPVVCPDHGPCYEGSSCIMCNQNLDEVIVTGSSGSTSSGISVTDIYIDDSPDFTDEEETVSWIADDGAGGGGGFDCPYGQTKDENGNCVEAPDKIDSDDLTGKEKCLHDLLTKNGNTFVKDLLANFKGDSEFDIKIVSKDKVFKENDPTKDEVNANCSPPKNNVMTIQISTSMALGRSALSVAKTIFHEYIHADIFRKLKTKDPTSADLDFKETFKEYEKQFSDELQHEAMADLYVHSMRDALKDFHKNVLTDDYNKYIEYFEETPSDAFYEALAWKGLKDHDVKAYTDLLDKKKKELDDEASKLSMLTKNCPDSN